MKNFHICSRWLDNKEMGIILFSETGSLDILGKLELKDEEPIG